MKIITKKQEKKLYELLNAISNNNRMMYHNSDYAHKEENSIAFLDNGHSLCDICDTILSKELAMAFYIEQLKKFKEIYENIKKEKN